MKTPKLQIPLAMSMWHLFRFINSYLCRREDLKVKKPHTRHEFDEQLNYEVNYEIFIFSMCYHAFIFFLLLFLSLERKIKER